MLLQIAAVEQLAGRGYNRSDGGDRVVLRWAGERTIDKGPCRPIKLCPATRTTDNSRRSSIDSILQVSPRGPRDAELRGSRRPSRTSSKRIPHRVWPNLVVEDVSATTDNLPTQCPRCAYAILRLFTPPV